VITRVALAAALLVLAVSTPARAAGTLTVPAGSEARAFTSSAGGWTGSASTGASAVHARSGGTQGPSDGYLNTTFSAFVSGASASWRSPQFTAGDVRGGTFAVAVRPQLSAMFAAQGTLKASLVDVAAGAATPITTAALTPASSFSTMTAALPAGALTEGREYALELTITVTATVGTGSVALDDVALQLVSLLRPRQLAADVSGNAVAGTVDPQGQPTTVVVDYGATSDYGSSTPAVTVSGSGAQPFTVPLTGLTPGETYHWRVTATNADGAAHTADASLTVPPLPANAMPSVTGAANGRARTVLYDLVDGTLTAAVQVLDANQNVVSTTPVSGGSQAIMLPDRDGTYGVRIVRTGASGDSTSQAVQVTLDRVAPSLAGADYRVTPALSNDRSRTARFTVPADAVSADIDGTPAPGGTATIQLPAADGTYRPVLTVKDAAGNAASVQAPAVTLDTTPPAAAQAPSVAGADNQRARTVAFTQAADAVTATIQVLDAHGTVVVTGAGNGVTLPGEDGAYRIRIAQIDAAGNSSFGATTAVTLDTQAPDAGPAPTVTGSGRTRQVAFTRAPDAVTATVLALDTRGQVAALSATTSLELPDQDGDYDIAVRQTDAAGNVSYTASTRVTLDRRAPVAGQAPIAAGSLQSRDRAVTFVRDNTTATAYATITRLDGSKAYFSATGGDNRIAITLPDADGTYPVTVTQVNADGLSATSPQTQVVLDRVAPAAGGAPIVGGAGNTRTRTITFNRAPDAAGYVVQVLDDHDQLAFSGTTTTVTLPDLDGVYRVRVRQYDLAGNSSLTAPTAFTLDRVAPDAGPAPVITGAANARARTVVFQRAPDAITAVLQVYDANGDWRAELTLPEGSNTTLTLPDMDQGYWVRVRQTDAAGNHAYSAMSPAKLLRATDVDGGDSGNGEEPIDPTPSPGGGEGGPNTPDDGATGAAGTDSSSDGTVAPGPSAPQQTDPGGYGTLLRDCYGADVAITDVRKAGKVIAISGLTTYEPGTTVTVRDNRGRAVATTVSGTTGRFVTTVSPAATSYDAVAGTSAGRAMTVNRASVIDAVSVSGGTAQLDGKVKPGTRKLTVRGGRGSTACRQAKALKLSGKVKLNRRTGAFSVRVKLPRGGGPVAMSVGGSAYVIR